MITFKIDQHHIEQLFKSSHSFEQFADSILLIVIKNNIQIDLEKLADFCVLNYKKLCKKQKNQTNNFLKNQNNKFLKTKNSKNSKGFAKTYT